MTFSEYVRIADKYARFLVASKITVDEYAENLLDSCVIFPAIDEDTANAVVLGVPEIAQQRLDEVIRRVLSPGYRYPELKFGGPGPSRDVREELCRLYERRIKACATALAVAFKTLSSDAEPRDVRQRRGG